MIPAIIAKGIALVTQIAAKVGPVIAKYGKILMDVAPKVIEFIYTIAEVLNILKPQEDKEDLGIKAQEAEKSRDDFESAEEYVDYLDEEVEVSEEIKANLTEEERENYIRIGAAIAIEALNEKLGVETTVPLWKLMSEADLSAEDIEAVLSVFDDKQDSIDKLMKFNERELDPKDNLAYYDALVEALKASDKEHNQTGIDEIIGNLQK